MLIYENIDTQSEDFKIYLLITKHSFESFMCLDLVLERQHSCFRCFLGIVLSVFPVLVKVTRKA